MLLTIIFLSQNLFALPQTNTWSDYKVKEVLSLPVFNRDMLMKQAPEGINSQLEKIVMTEDEKMGLRWRALMEISKRDKTLLSSLLEYAENSDDWYMRNAAVVASQNADKEVSYDISMKLLSDRAMVVRAAAAKRLGELEDRRALMSLHKSLLSKDNFRKGQSLWVRQEVARAIVNIDPKLTEGNYTRWLNDSDQEIQKIAMDAFSAKLGVKLAEEGDDFSKRLAKWQQWWGL
jgi:HEAT repeat protein